MSWLKNLDPANASKSFTGILKNIEARLDAVLDIPNSSSEPKLADSNTIHLDVPWVAPSDALEDSGGTETLIASRPVNAPEIGPQNASVLAHGPENVPQDVPASENASSSATAKDTEITAVTAAATTTDTTVIKEADTTVVKEAETTVVKEADTTVVKEAETTVVKEAETTVAEEINGDAREKNVQKLHKEIKKLQDLVQELRKEGEELSKKEGLGRETIRKLKSKELESARNLKELNRNIQERDGEIQDLVKTRDKLLDLEKKQTDSIRNLNDYNQEISKKLKLAQGEIETVQKELLNLQKEQSLGNSEQNKDHEKLIQEFKEFQKTSLEKEEELKQELYEIRKTLDNKIKENGWKEDQHQKEIANLNLRLQASESRMEDLSSIAQEASKPLLRQIESLQTQYNSSLKDWESLERSMANRVKDAELSRSQSVENARILKEENQQLLIQLNNAENLASHLKNDKSRLEFELNELKNTLQAEREKLLKESTASTFLKESHKMEIEQLKSALDLKFKKQLESEKRSWLEDKEAEIARIKAAQAFENPRRNSVSQRSTESGVKENKQFEINKSNVIMIEKLQLSIKQSEAMVESLQTQLSLITKTRDDLADELYKVSLQNEDLKASNRELEALKNEKKSLQDKLMACAELIGEREETIIELKADITEMRQVYQSQVEELCSKIKDR